MIEFFQNGNGWLVVGLLLIIVEMVLNLGYVSISFGIGAIATGLLIKGDLIPTVFDTGLVDELLIEGVVSVLALIALRVIFNRKGDPDINKY